jgi:mono/diheme cytochrome c family protein
MAKRKLKFAILLVTGIMFVAAACAPPSNLPEGPTPIPTLMPVTDIPDITEPTQAPSFAILSYPARPPSSEDGQSIYTELCAECHGDDGSGVVTGSRNFQDLDYMRGVTPADFYVAITEGRGDMPGYNDTLSSDERWDVVFYVWRHSTTSDLLGLGEEVYDERCGSCHGVDGSGELLGSANFTDLRQMDELAPRDLYLTVTQGRGSMPAMQSLLSQAERWAVIDYLRTFSYDPMVPQEIGIASPAGATQTEEPLASTCPPGQVNPYAWDDSDVILEGQAAYLLQCALCHGPDGSGGLPNTPDFTTSEISNALRENPGQSICSITEGIGVMPAFGGALSEDELWQVLTFIGSLGEP